MINVGDKISRLFKVCDVEFISINCKFLCSYKVCVYYSYDDFFSMRNDEMVVDAIGKALKAVMDIGVKADRIVSVSIAR